MSAPATAEETDRITQIIEKLANGVVQSAEPSAVVQDITSNHATVVYEQYPLFIVLEVTGDDVSFSSASLLHDEGFQQVIEADGTVKIVTDDTFYEVISSLHPQVFEGVLTDFENLTAQFT